MKIESKRFGSINVKEDRVLTFEGGLMGFSELEKFVLVDDQVDPSLPFKWLISIEEPEYGFLVTDPGIFFKDYVFDLSEEDRAAINANTEDDVSVITLLTIPADPKMITANLRGPLVINWKTLKGKQVVLDSTGYATKHYIFLQANDAENSAEESKGANTASNISAAAVQSASSADTEVKTQSS